MKEIFEEHNFRAATLDVIDQANRIVESYKRQGFRLTVRQLYYQMVARGLIPNSQRSYKRIVKIVGNARLGGMIDWDAIEDRTRALDTVSHWSSPSSIIDSAAYGYRIDKWARQPNRVEVWIEKEALSGVIAPVCSELDIGFFAARGYPSLSEFYGAGKRFARWNKSGQEVHVIHLGDHDPSGMDMTRDIERRATLFAERWIDVDRVALNFDQIELYDPPPNPAKTTDSRYATYAMQYGDESWELDALEPTVLADLIRTNVAKHRDEDLWREDVAKEEEERAELLAIASRWSDVVWFLKEDDTDYGKLNDPDDTEVDNE